MEFAKQLILQLNNPSVSRADSSLYTKEPWCTDFHYNDVPTNAGILTENEITSMEQLVDILKSGKYELIRG